jgi:hypothetical protein
MNPSPPFAGKYQDPVKPQQSGNPSLKFSPFPSAKISCEKFGITPPLDMFGSPISPYRDFFTAPSGSEGISGKFLEQTKPERRSTIFSEMEG